MLTNDNSDSRRMVEQCYRLHKTVMNPIIDWTDAEVWGFIKSEGVQYCSLYDEGFDRLGCIGCPMARRKRRLIEFARWPKYQESYIRAFDRMISERKLRDKQKRKSYWTSGEAVMRWWLEDKNCEGQTSLFDEDSSDDGLSWILI